MEAIEFLLNWPKPWVLAAIPTEGGAPSVATFDSGEHVRAWLERHTDHNFYFHVNPLKRRVTKKARKDDVREMVCYHVDVDPRDGMPIESERERIKALMTNPPLGCSPTVLIDSGNGFQGFWMLKESIPVTDPDKQSEVNKRIAQRVGGDKCHNLDRLMRLPGTLNRPDARKRKLGRVQRKASLVWADWDRVYTEADLFPRDSDDLDMDALSSRIVDVIKRGMDADYDGKYDSRSEAVMGVTIAMVEAGFDDDRICSILTDESNAVSAHIHDQKQPQRYAKRQCDRARELIKERADQGTDDDGELSFKRSEKTPHPIVPQLCHNTMVALHKLDVSVRYDEFADRIMVDDKPITDAIETQLWVSVQEKFNFMPTRTFFSEYLKKIALDNAYHPVRDYVTSVEWDGKPRIDTWLRDYAGVEDSPYSRAISRVFLLAAVNRVFRPGCKFDEMIVLEGPQGALKSTLLSTLAVRDEWFHDHVPLNSSKKFLETSVGKWLLEVAELSTMRNVEVEQLKRMLSSRSDKARLAYGRHPIDRHRQCVLIGTTNENEYLRDMTGNRRFWPVQVGEVKIDDLQRDRHQLWAEAFKRMDEPIRLPKQLWHEAGLQQEARVEIHPWEDTLADAFEGREGKIKTNTVYEVLDLPTERRSRNDARTVGKILRRMGFHREKQKFPGEERTSWCYVRGDRREVLHPKQVF